MRKGYSLVELTVYIALIVMFFSLMVPSVEEMRRQLIFSADTESVEHLIRYAREISMIKKMRSVISINDGKICVFANGKKIKSRKLTCKAEGKRIFAFSNGIPYLSGKLFLELANKKISITVYPVTGMIKSEWE